MNDIYSPPGAEISVDRERIKPTFLKSLGGLLLSLLAVNVLVIVAAVIQRWLYVSNVAASLSIAFGLARLSIHLAWIVAWPMYCRKREWPNLYRGARWHRLLFIAVVTASAVILLGIAAFA